MSYLSDIFLMSNDVWAVPAVSHWMYPLIISCGFMVKDTIFTLWFRIPSLPLKLIAPKETVERDSVYKLGTCLSDYCPLQSGLDSRPTNFLEQGRKDVSRKISSVKESTIGGSGGGNLCNFLSNFRNSWPRMLLKSILVSSWDGQMSLTSPSHRMQKEAGVRGKGRSARWWRHGEKGRGEERREGRGVN